MEYILFFRDNKRIISFGILLTFFSSFGQTFLISLYVPDVIRTLGVTNSVFGSMYAAATILGALSLMYFGRLIDRVSLRAYTNITAIILLISCLLIAITSSHIGIFMGLFGLRFAGQGLLAHIALTTMSRLYDYNRGKALSLSVLGFALGEAIFPVTMGYILGLYHWRMALVFSAVLIGVVLIPLVSWLLASIPDRPENEKREDTGMQPYRTVIRDWKFFVIALNSIILPFMVTGLLFYQLILAQEKGWTLEWLATCFIGFAVLRTVGSIISGPLVDRFSAVLLFPLYLLPFFIGIILITVFSHPYVALAYLSLTGLSMGLSATVKGALLAEVYGTSYIGSIRSLFSALGVFSTALSPVLMGILLDWGWRFTTISVFGATCVGVVIGISYTITPQRDALPIPSQD